MNVYFFNFVIYFLKIFCLKYLIHFMHTLLGNYSEIQKHISNRFVLFILNRTSCDFYDISSDTLPH